MRTVGICVTIGLITFVAACRPGQKPVVMFTIAGDAALLRSNAASKLDGEAFDTSGGADTVGREMQLDPSAIAREEILELKKIPRTKDQLMRLDLFADLSVNLRIDKFANREDGLQPVLGHLEGLGPGVAYLSIDDLKDQDPSNDEVTGTVERSDGTGFVLTPLGNRRHRVTEVKRDYADKDGNEPIPLPGESSRPREQPEPTDDPGVLRLLLVYSNQYSLVCTGKQGKADASIWKQQIADAFTTARSNVTVDVFIFCSADDLLGGNLKESIDRLRISADVAAARANVTADLVTLVVDGGTETGLAFYNFILLPTDADRAYSAVRYTEAKTRKAIEHEMGHVLGMQHDRFVFGGGDTDLCNYGAFIPIGSTTPTHRTIMATRQFCTAVCDRLREYSDPNATTRASGVVCSNPTGADNALHLRRAAVVASRFFFP